MPLLATALLLTAAGTGRCSWCCALLPGQHYAHPMSGLRPRCCSCCALMPGRHYTCGSAAPTQRTPRSVWSRQVSNAEPLRRVAVACRVEAGWLFQAIPGLPVSRQTRAGLIKRQPNAGFLKPPWCQFSFVVIPGCLSPGKPGSAILKGSPWPFFWNRLGVVFFRRHPQVACL